MNKNSQKPKEYKQSWAMFYGRRFFVNHNVLIPRIETEEIISMVPEKKGTLIADVGCGSGCLGLTLALKSPSSTVYLSDISKKALAVAKQNNSSQNTRFLVSNLFDSFPKVLFDTIVANLPYIPTARIPTLDSSVKDFEPHQALDGGPEGATLINKLLGQLPSHLKSTGLAIFEIDDTHTLKNFSIPEGFEGAIKNDKFSRNRFLLIHKKSMGQIL